MNRTDNWKARGIPVRATSILMAGITVVMSLLLMVTTYQTGESYRNLRVITEEYVDMKDHAYDMQLASDYLTEQARLFAETGDRVYLDNYFEEVNVTKRRDNALATLRETIGKTDAYQDLKFTLAQSNELMTREYYSMRLTVAAYGYDVSQFPQEIQDVQLDGSDARLSARGQSELARRMVFDEEYLQKKESISEGMQKCLTDLAGDLNAQQLESSNQLHDMLVRQQTMIIILIVVTLGIVLLTSTQVISPLLGSVLNIREDQEIPVRGAYEFRFLARTYNVMYEINQKSKKQLEYEASHDKLTGLYNRSGYEFLMENEALEDRALLLVDVDNFKRINDTFGHEMGDRVLVWVSSVLRNSFRAQDHVCRLGGDEFVVLMQAISPDHRVLISEKIEAINKRLIEAENGLPRTSISVGVAFGGDDADPKVLFEHADAALYQVKEHGRKDCAFYEPEGAQEA